MVNYDEREREILALFPAVVGAALGAGAQASVERLHEAERGLYEKQMALVVMGEFSRGKSSLINALLEEPGLLPVDSYLSTRAVTTLRWGAEEVITVSLAAHGERRAEERRISREELRSHLCESAVADGYGAPDADRVSAVSIELPNPRLESGVLLVDTPGVGGVYRSHSTATLGVLPIADAVLYVTDALQPLLASELAFINVVARAVGAATHAERLLFVVTKCDQSPDVEAAVLDLRTRLRAVPGLAPERLAIVPVSSHLRLAHLTEHDPEDFELSNFGPLEEKLWPTLARSGARLLQEAALAELDRVTTSLLAPVEAVLSVMNTEDRSVNERLAAAADAEEKRAAALADGSAVWPDRLAEEMTAVTVELKQRVDTDLAEMWRTLRYAYRGRQELLDDPQLLLDRVAQGLALLTAELSQLVRKRAAEVHKAFEVQTRVQLRDTAPGGLATPPLPTASAAVQSRRPDPSSPLLTELLIALDTATEGARRGAEAGGRLGEVAWEVALRRALPAEQVERGVTRVLKAGEGPYESPAALVGRMVGGVVGATLSFTRQLRWLRELAHSERVHALDQVFESWEPEQKAFLQTALAEVVEAHTRQVTEDLRHRVEERRTECAASARAIAAARAAVGQDRAVERAAAEQRCTVLLTLQERIHQLAEDLRTQGAS
ncbi:dynamin family protein [Streptomyces alboniger]|uniref:Dynamin N-terminal domain-containing protein n=1 Tax=Streptomyces alboniger TaxID=132473 RepID=A0A5J6HDA3_STRAD|nr:dynamin family protein [Streptomyces alboniger]QEV16570.1 hypothetical protein CP975_02765 [Streptomyces alboniger]